MDTKQLNIELDIHSHTLASGHAYGTIREMAQAAAEKGLKLLGISEHGPGVPGTCHTFYFDNLYRVPRELYGVRMLMGSEVNILDDGSLFMEEKTLAKLDYVIAGIHLVCYEVGDIEKNTAATLKAIAHPRVNIISHPDDSNIPVDYKRLARAAAEHQTLLEVNASSLRRPSRRPGCWENDREMLRWCKHYGAAVILDSDAHDPCEVGDLDAALELLEDVDFPEELIMNTSAERVLKLFEEKRARI